MAGADNVYADLDVESVRVSYEEAIRRQPDVVVACWCGVRRLPEVERVLARPGWGATPAFQRRRVAVLSEAYFGRPGPRLVQGLEQLRALLSTFEICVEKREDLGPAVHGLLLPIGGGLVVEEAVARRRRSDGTRTSCPAS